MNRFLNKKKGVEDVLSPPQAGKKWRKGKKAPQLEEQKPQLDLTMVLPPSDDFRTSLIMPTLSTRFSMLREQDDPNTKVGKASDDSVLQPRRSSRLLDFGFSSNTLNDIAEVASINSSIRPPFASERQDSYGSEEGYGTDNDSTHNGSMMSRSRPGEGNVLFGGRQKIYKIPTSSARSISATNERSMGKVIYDDDINLSAFQKYRSQQQRDAAESAVQDLDAEHDLHEAETTDSGQGLGDDDGSGRNSDESVRGIGLGLSHSESTASTFKRSSDSTTTSAPSQGRSSTAATSVASQSIGTAVTTPAPHPPATAAPPPPLERSMTKRRLYDQGLEKNMYEQQASTITRLNSIQRQRSPTVGSIKSPPSLSHSRSIGHMQERGFQPYVLQNSSQSATNAFPPLGLPSLKPSSNTSSPVSSYPQSPMSPAMSDSEAQEALHSALEPGDRGKATAMGAFNRPKQQYDEEQYMQRQAQLQQSNSAVVSRKNSIEIAKQSEPRLARFDSGKHTTEPHAAERSRSRSISSQADSNHNAFAVFQNAAIQNRVVHGENPALPPAVPLPPAPSLADTHRTFFGDISASDDEEEDIVSDFERSGPHYVPNNYMSPTNSGRFTPTALHSVSEHPALRHETPNIPEVDEEEEEEEEEQTLPTLPRIHAASVHPSGTEFTIPARLSHEDKDIDSPTIGAKESLGGMIHHLRNTSDQSSIYPAVPHQGSEPSTGDDNFRSMDQTLDSDYAGPNSWDLDELDSYYGDSIANNTSSHRDSAINRGQPLASAKTNTYPSRPSTRDSDVVDSTIWNYATRKQHTREASTATQAERQAFDDELAARQRAIQEKMRSVVESESRGTSPAPSAAGALKAFGMLKAKPSREVISRDGSSKTMKMLGMGAQNSQHQDKFSIYEDPEANNSRIVAHGNAWVPPANAHWPLAGPSQAPDAVSMQGQRPRGDSETGTREVRGLNGRSPPHHPAMRERSRTRSNSAASRTRSRSRTGGYRDEFDAPPEVPQVPAARPSVETTFSTTPSSAENQGRMRSNSKPGGYFDSRALHPAHSGLPNARMTPGGASPASGSPAAYSPAGSTPRPSYSTVTSSASLSKSGSPAMSVPHVPVGRPVGSLLRKKTINKADIGEPKLISSTSNVDTVDLPTARTIVQPPLIPVLNPRRRVFTQGDRPSGEVSRNAFSPPLPQHAATFSPPAAGDWDDRGSQRSYPRAVRSQESIDAQAARFDAIGSPVMNEAGMF